MGANSKIEWCDHTFNPWWGCTKVSPGCDHCYADAFSKRTGHTVWGKDAPRRFLSEENWNQPGKWNAQAEKAGTRRRVFCGSMCDVMEDRRDLDPWRMRLFSLIEKTPSLDWLLLTKRPQNYARLLPPHWSRNLQENLWLMTSVESAEYLWRIEASKQVPAAVHGLSLEPLLAPLPPSRSTSAGSIGSSWAAKAALELARWKRIGSARFASNAGSQPLTSFLSSGAAFTNTRTGAGWTSSSTRPYPLPGKTRRKRNLKTNLTI